MKQYSVTVTLLACCIFVVPCDADEAAGQGAEWLAALVRQAETETAAVCNTPPVHDAWEKPIPLGFYVKYTVVTDYIWYGINYSEYPGEGREKLNHWLTVGTNYDTGDFGKFDFSVFFEWYGGYHNMTGDDSHGNLQEVDYAISWTYDLSKLCPDVPVWVTLAWYGYDYAQLSGDASFSDIWCVTLTLDDQKLMGEGWFALNPSITYAQDIDDVGAQGQGSGLFFCMNHPFILAKCPGLGKIPIVRDLTVTPSFMLSFDVGYIDSGTRPLATEYGLAVGYDLTEVLGVPKKYGTVTLTGFVNYSDAITDDSPNINLDDELWGGFEIGWEW